MTCKRVQSCDARKEDFMLSKRVAAGFALMVLAIFMVGCCSEEDCKNKYGLIKKTSTACTTEFTNLVDKDIGTGDSPIIILEPMTNNPTLLGWRKDTDTDYFDEDDSMFNTLCQCELRRDLIGHKAKLEYQPMGSSNWVTLTDKDTIHGKKSSARITIDHSFNLLWHVYELTGPTPLCSGSPAKLRNFPADKVPTELFNLLPGELKVQTENNPAVVIERLRITTTFFD